MDYAYPSNKMTTFVTKNRFEAFSNENKCTIKRSYATSKLPKVILKSDEFPALGGLSTVKTPTLTGWADMAKKCGESSERSKISEKSEISRTPEVFVRRDYLPQQTIQLSAEEEATLYGCNTDADAYCGHYDTIQKYMFDYGEGDEYGENYDENYNEADF